MLHSSDHGLNVYYINGYPIIGQIESEVAKGQPPPYDLLEQLLLLDTKFGIYEPIQTNRTSIMDTITGGVASFARVGLVGNTSIVAPSAILSYATPSTAKIFVRDTNETMVLTNISYITPIRADDVNITSNYPSIINGGSGFYTNILLNKSSVLFSGLDNEGIISINLANSSRIVVQGKEVQIDSDKVEVLARQPRVESDGIADFVNFYSYGELRSQIRLYGNDLTVKGKTSFTAQYSDQLFTIANSTQIDGDTAIKDDTRYNYNELIVLVNIFSSPLIIIILVVAVVYIIFKSFFSIQIKRKPQLHQ